MVSFNDPQSVRTGPRVFTFTNGRGDTRKIAAFNITEAWIMLGKREELSADELIEQDWQVQR